MRGLPSTHGRLLLLRDPLVPRAAHNPVGLVGGEGAGHLALARPPRPSLVDRDAVPRHSKEVAVFAPVLAWHPDVLAPDSTLGGGVCSPGPVDEWFAVVVDVVLKVAPTWPPTSRRAARPAQLCRSRWWHCPPTRLGTIFCAAPLARPRGGRCQKSFPRWGPAPAGSQQVEEMKPVKPLLSFTHATKTWLIV